MADTQRPAVKPGGLGVEMGAYGMGWFVQETDQGAPLWHNGQVPDHFACVAPPPERRRGPVLLTNSNQMPQHGAQERFHGSTNGLITIR
ncbi:MAG: hypothetical protein N2378_09695 [Chloroflexaceae bacterium]|nr:hypothetical protein [Chloroflexaceae bacterium]